MKSPHVLTSENAKDALQDLFQARARPQHACVCVCFCLYNTEKSGAATCAMTTLTARTITQQLIINARLHSSYLTHAVGYDMKTHAVCKTCPFFFLPPPSPEELPPRESTWRQLSGETTRGGVGTWACLVKNRDTRHDRIDTRHGRKRSAHHDVHTGLECLDRYSRCDEGAHSLLSHHRLALIQLATH